MVVDVERIISVIERFQVLDFFIPMVIFTAIFYSVLSNLKLFKEERTNSILSICLAAIITLAHITGRIPPCYDAVGIMIDVLPKLGIYIFGLIIFVVILGIIGVAGNLATSWKTPFLVVTIIFFAYAFLSSRGPDCAMYVDITSEGTMVLLIFAIIAGIGYLVVTKSRST